MSAQQLRNIAIIAHVDHGKTTLVDHMLRQSGTFRANEAVTDRVMDSMDLEKERGITILAKNTAVRYGEYKINIVDTPGHADFGAEVERVLKLVDAAMLLVDASEGPLPQTRFVLTKALEAGLTMMVCINKIDRPDARVEEVVSEIYDLFIDLGAEEDQLDFPILYACAKEGYCHTEPKLEPGDLRPMFDAIIEHVPPPKGDPDAPQRMLVTQLDYDNYLGRLAVGRVFDGTLRRNEDLLLVGDGTQRKVRLTKLFGFEGLHRVERDEIPAGELCAIAGIADLDIGDSLTSIENPRPMPRVHVEEPTIGVTFTNNSGPFAGQDGKFVTGRQILERLEKEAQLNVSFKLEVQTDGTMKIYGRGELQVAILIEQMRREGFEMCVGKPEVVVKEDEEGNKTEPYELAHLDFPEEYMGLVSEKMNLRRGRMLNMKVSGSGRVRVEYRVPSRGLIGFRGEFLNDTRGQGILNTLFDAYDEYAGYIPFRMNGSLVADRTGKTTPYALFHLQPRGKLFVRPGIDCYEGMIVGENARGNDMNVNVNKSKGLNNVRTAGADEKLILAPPMPLTIEKALEYIAEDEYVEITPNFLRMRKKELAGNLRSVVRGEKKPSKK